MFRWVVSCTAHLEQTVELLQMVRADNCLHRDFVCVAAHMPSKRMHFTRHDYRRAVVLCLTYLPTAGPEISHIYAFS